MSKVKQKITVRTPDRTRFIDTVIELASQGAKRLPNTVPRMISPFMVEMEIEVDRDKLYKSTPTTRAFQVRPDTYTESQMRDMVWDEFRAACTAVGVKGRDREIMLAEYLNKVQNLT